GPAADPGRSGGPAGRPDHRKDPARRPGHRDGSEPLLHGLARRQGHGRQDDELGHARGVPEGLRVEARIPGPDSGEELVMLVRLLYASRAVDITPEAIEA